MLERAGGGCAAAAAGAGDVGACAEGVDAGDDAEWRKRGEGLERDLLGRRTEVATDATAPPSPKGEEDAAEGGSTTAGIGPLGSPAPLPPPPPFLSTNLVVD